VFTVCGITHRRCCQQTATQSSAPEDERNYRPKHVELIEITNKLLVLLLVGCLYYCIRDAQSHKHQIDKSDSFLLMILYKMLSDCSV